MDDLPMNLGILNLYIDEVEGEAVCANRLFSMSRWKIEILPGETEGRWMNLK